MHSFHKSYSRIDYFLLDRQLLPLLTLIDYKSIVISDHCPVVLHFCFRDLAPPQRSWRFNSRLLSDDKFVEFINSQIDSFIETNSSPDISYSILWDTFKAYIRGQIISYTASDRKRKCQRLSHISDRLKTIDQNQAGLASEDFWKERAVLQAEHELLMNEKAIDMYMKSRQQCYEYGERAGKMLSHQLKQMAAASYISEIKDQGGNIITDQEGINNQFKLFYQELYVSEQCDQDSIEDFFKGVQLPTLTEKKEIKEIR